MDTRYVAVGLTNIGKARKENEDAFYLNEEQSVCIVADGMGGMSEGAMVARYVVEGLLRLFKEMHPKVSNAEEIIAHLKEIVGELSARLRERVGNGVGATLVLTFINGKDLYVAHLGDSRAYLLHQGVLERLTKDHNIAAILEEMGKIDAEEARTHPMRHRLTGYVGMEGIAIPEAKRIAIEPGDRVLLCTDGLTGMLPDNEILDILTAEKDRKRALEKLVARANEEGGYDNITAVLIDFLNDGEEVFS